VLATNPTFGKVGFVFSPAIKPYQIGFGNTPEFVGGESLVKILSEPCWITVSGNCSVLDRSTGDGCSTPGAGVGTGIGAGTGTGVGAADGAGSGRDRPGKVLGAGTGIGVASGMVVGAGVGVGTSIGSEAGVGSGAGVSTGLGLGVTGDSIGLRGTRGERIGAGAGFTTEGVGLGFGFGATKGTLQPVT
jgi:hypothetical protein